MALGSDSVSLRFTIDAQGPSPDSLAVHLRVMMHDSLMYQRSWPSSDYLECACDPAEVPAFQAGMKGKIVGLVEALLDSGFVAASAEPRFWEAPSYENAVLSQIAPQFLPTGATAEDSAAISTDAFRLESHPLVERARNVRREQIGNTVFGFQYGSEPYCIIGWSPAYRRVLELLCGP